MTSLSYSEYQELVKLYEDSDRDLNRIYFIYKYSSEYADIFEALDNLPENYQEILLLAIESKIKKELEVKRKEEAAARRLALNRKLKEFEEI
jgi:hypothetical protein